MKQLQKDLHRAYEAPVMTEVNMASGSVLCASGTSGTLEKFGWIEDEEGWN